MKTSKGEFFPNQPEGRGENLPKSSRIAPLHRTAAVLGRSKVTGQHAQFSPHAGAVSPSPIGWERAGVRVGDHGEEAPFWMGDWRLAIAEERVAMAEERLARAEEALAGAKEQEGSASS